MADEAQEDRVRKTALLPSVRVTPVLGREIRAAAKASRVSVAAYITTILEGHDPPRPYDELRAGVIADLRRLGTNLNQLTRQSNAGHNVSEHLAPVLQALLESISEIREAFFRERGE